SCLKLYMKEHIKRDFRLNKIGARTGVAVKDLNSKKDGSSDRHVFQLGLLIPAIVLNHTILCYGKYSSIRCIYGCLI
ncbi:hypothetical protein ACJX0J_028418, partial [Zea mays]